LHTEEAARQKERVPSSPAVAGSVSESPPPYSGRTFAAGEGQSRSVVSDGPSSTAGSPSTLPSVSGTQLPKKNGEDGVSAKGPVAPPSPGSVRPPENEEVDSFRRKLAELGDKSEREYSERLVKAFQRAQERLDARPAEKEPFVEEKALSSADSVNDSGVQQKRPDPAPRIERSQSARVPHKLEDEDVLYIHAVTRIPEGEPASPEPFLLEEKGIDGLNFAFALDHQGLRFYLSKIRQGIMNVSKNGMLLLNKQESLQRLGAHEGILNDLRSHGILLPIEFGTVARGTDDLFNKLDRHCDNIKEVLDVVFSTSWWALNLYVLDARIAQLVGTGDSQARRERDTERASYSAPVQATKYDFKAMERILSREKKIAESIHEELSKVVERSDIDQIADLGSSLSEDWKLILKASYKVTGPGIQDFYKAVVDLQYRHVIYDLMLAVTGDLEYYSFKKK